MEPSEVRDPRELSTSAPDWTPEPLVLPGSRQPRPGGHWGLGWGPAPAVGTVSALIPLQTVQCSKATFWGTRHGRDHHLWALLLMTDLPPQRKHPPSKTHIPIP